MDRLGLVDWSVCPSARPRHHPERGTALTYAVRSALFALVGIAYEDESRRRASLGNCRRGDRRRSERPQTAHRHNTRTPAAPKPLVAGRPSAALRGQLIAEIADLTKGDGLALWEHRRLPATNSFMADANQNGGASRTFRWRRP
jgi:hypothetical protein